MASRVEDYALIGDCQTAALVGRDGSIDRLSLPRFDSPACFAALLGTHDHGRWLLAPAGSVRAVRRRYRPDTLVLETEYETDEGVVAVIDCMPPREDDAVKAVERFGLAAPVDRWRRLRDAIHDDVCRKGFDPALNAFVQYYGAKELDASLLMIPLVGFLPATDPRMLGTVQAIQEKLILDGFVMRYATRPAVDGLPPGEAAFLACTFWLADNHALQGRRPEARLIFERLLAVRNDLGLLAEQYDPALGRLLGNFPQAFSHVGLVNTARNLTAHGGPAEQRPTG